MKKIILLLLIVLPIAGYAQEAQKDSLNNISSGLLFVNASKSLTDGILFSIGGIALGTTSVIVLSKSMNESCKHTKVALSAVGSAAGIITTSAGTVMIYKGYRGIGKAGKRLEYELGAMDAKIALKF